MSDRINLADEFHRKGYSCSQSVAVACADLVDVPKEILFKATESFGAGMGTTDGVCGAVCKISLNWTLQDYALHR